MTRLQTKTSHRTGRAYNHLAMAEQLATTKTSRTSLNIPPRWNTGSEMMDDRFAHGDEDKSPDTREQG